MNNTVGKLAAAFTIKELVSNITKVRGEFQQLEVSFQTMLGSAETVSYTHLDVYKRQHEDSFTVETEFERRFSPVKIALAAFITGCVAGIVLTFKIMDS